ncbi:TBC1 domain family member 5 [Nannizzia gypsea CBS 118893]|uniref:TBC1 domain family member 5 n=1 Tax=Arthroderma gypseum (strain ATCC MYA-4604 / CBS 118893) TaxID=535722 RepID=E5QYI6_ARTGP|nr:TBC1 domain family member 5 [Nannizzia gypsea CBS 118893]EFQ98062.1 TBC1 domain family member 5 [Nannizzia gypsea CBS 118893]
MRSVEESRALWNTTFHQPEIHSLHELKQVLEAGAKGSNPCEDGLRSVCWKAFLLHKEIDQTQWSIQLSDSREAYASVKQHFLKYIDNPNELSSTVDPLAEDAESPWESLRRDEQIRAEISQDVERCLQDNSFFHDPIVKLRLLNILFVFVKLNPDLGYRQGMHELLAPILLVVTQDAIDLQTVSQDEAPAPGGEQALMLQSLDPTYIEHDSFILFCAIMQTAKEFYEHNDSKSGGGGNLEVSSIIARSQHIHLGILRKIDPELADHLVAIEVLPQIFLTRWIRLLFGREFPFDDVLALWDLIIAENVRAPLVDMICVSMILRIRWQLMDADYSTALSLLLRYPSPEPIKPRAFVLDGLYLEHNTTCEGASYLVHKYSDKHIPQKVQNSASPPPGAGMSLPTRQKSRSITRDIFNSPSSSPNRLTSKRLDSIFQDVSEGLYRRAEGWGVTKAVRGAVTEARRNMQGLQAGATNTSLFSHDGPAWDSPSPPRLSLATVRELKMKMSMMEQRNKDLATMLEDALNTLQAQQPSPAATEEKGIEGEDSRLAMDDAVATIRKVKACLEDAAISLSPAGTGREVHRPSNTRSSEDSPTRGRVQATVDRALEPAKLSKEDELKAAIAASMEEPQSPQSPPSSISAANNNNDQNTLSSNARNTINTTASTKVHPSRPTRTSVRDSSFSWILGDDQARPSFATSASAPPEQRRVPLKSLFDNPEGESDGRTAFGGLLLSDLQHAPQSMQQQRRPQSPDQ